MFPTVTKTELPAPSRLHARVGPGDFLDCYATRSDLSASAAAEIITAFPGWAQGLVVLRNVMMAPFGLMKDGPETADKVGFFPVEYRSARELIAGFDDKHLDFRVSVFSDAGQVSLATWVHPHNIGGRLYLKAILPFHILIVRNALARVARAAHPAPAT